MEQEEKQLLTFGYGLTAVLAVLGFRHWHHYSFDIMVAILLVVAAAFLLITIFSKRWLKILFRYWMKAVGLIGKIITGLILTVLFFTVFAAVGIILRLLRKDLLQLRMDPQAGSYWVIDTKIEKDPIKYTRQF